MKHLREFVTLLQMADIDLKQGEPMCRHTTFQIGGPVAVMAFPNSPEQVGEILKIARRYEITPMILGAGSNILAPDEGLDTVVIELRTAMNRVEERSKGEFEAQAGAAMARLALRRRDVSGSDRRDCHGSGGEPSGHSGRQAGSFLSPQPLYERGFGDPVRPGKAGEGGSGGDSGKNGRAYDPPPNLSAPGAPLCGQYL